MAGQRAHFGKALLACLIGLLVLFLLTFRSAPIKSPAASSGANIGSVHIDDPAADDMPHATSFLELGAMLLGQRTSHLSTNKAKHIYSDRQVSRESLGHRTWYFFHTLAAKLPDNPTAEQSDLYCKFFNLIPEVYPCKNCAGHFRKVLERNPCRASSRDDLTQWLCEAHNIVNERLKKPIFDCTKVDEVWGHPFEACSSNEDDPQEPEETTDRVETTVTTVTSTAFEPSKPFH